MKVNLIQKLIAYTFLVSILPLLVLGATSYLYSSSALKRQAQHFISTVLEKSEEILVMQLDQIETLTSQIAGIEEITSSLKKEINLKSDNGKNTVKPSHNSYEFLANKARIGYTLNRFLNIKGLVSIDLYGVNDVHYHVGDTLQEVELNDSWKNRLLRAAEDSKYPVFWYGVHENQIRNSMISKILPAIRVLRTINRNTLKFDLYGIVVVNYSVDHLYKSMSSIDIGKGSFLVILDQMNHLIYHPDKQLIGTVYQYYDLVSQSNLSTKSDIIRIDNQNMVVNQISVRNTGWKIISFVPVQTIETEIFAIGAITLSVIIASLIIVMVAGMAISRSLVRPVAEIIDSFKKYQNGELDLDIQLELHGSDEIAKLVQWFNTFTETLRQRRQYEIELERSKQKAEEATQSKSEFLANMSHEIRTPMNGIIGAADLALDEAVSPKVSSYLQIINNSGQTLLEIINDILDFSKIEAGKLDLEIVPVNLYDIIINIGDIFSGQTANKGIEMIFDVDTKIPLAVHGDPTRIKQIITNLVSNAVKFTDTGGRIIIGVNALEITDERVLYEFFVKDTGKGMKKSYLKNLFEAFTQEDASTTRQYGGTGLGMSICYLLVSIMNGQIRVESKKGVGTDFYFTLDLERQPKNQEKEFTIPEDISNLKVLIIDDSKDTLDILQKILNSFGYESTLMPNATGVENVFENNPFDLVITDWHMPGVDGIELTRRLKKIKFEVPIIMLNALGQEKERKAAEEAGIKISLTKPISSTTLYDAVMFVFGKGRKQRKDNQKISVYKNNIMDLDVRVLLAEDNRTNQKIAKAVLGTAGIKVDIANNGLEAVDNIKKKDYDIVLMDIQMPEMDGYEATKIIREDKRFAKLPIIAMTAHAMKGDEDKCLKAGMDGYVTKPIRQEVLFRTLWEKLEAGLDMAVVDDVEASVKENIYKKNPERLPGINVRGALESLRIDWSVYKTVLQEFRRNNLNIISQMILALNKNDDETLKNYAHSLKGSTANIGAQSLTDLAGNLEKAADNNTAKKGQIDDIKSELEDVFTSIQSLVDKSKKPGQKTGTGT